jgi:hypothetical protein
MLRTEVEFMGKRIGSSPTPGAGPVDTNNQEESKSDPKKTGEGAAATETKSSTAAGAVASGLAKGAAEELAKQAIGGTVKGSVMEGVARAGMATVLAAVKAANLSQAAGLKTPTPAQLKEIEGAIKSGDKQKAIELTVKYYNIDISSVKGMPKFNKDLSGEGVTRRYTKEVEIGNDAFEFNGKISPGWLASSILHETVHAKQLSDPQRLKNFDASAQTKHAVEVEAYDREIAEAKTTGLSKEMIDNLKARRKAEYDALTADNQKKHDKGDNASIK